MAFERYYPGAKALFKKVNARMRSLEKAGLNTVPYQHMQAELEMMGVRQGSASGRRYSETGVGEWNQIEHMMKKARAFLSAETSSVQGTRRVMNRVWKSANKGGKLSKRGITKEEYFKFWQEMPAKKADRMLGSEHYLNILEEQIRKNKRVEPAEQMSADEVARAVRSSRSVKDAYADAGLTYVSPSRRLKRAEAEQAKKAKKDKRGKK